MSASHADGGGSIPPTRSVAASLPRVRPTAVKPRRAGARPAIAVNRRARHDYHLDSRFEAGLALRGWEVKSLRAGRVQITDSHVALRRGEAWLLGVHITPLHGSSRAAAADADRSRKLLLSRRELEQLVQMASQRGHTCVCLRLYWRRHLVKCEVALARGKADHDKRAAIKEREWQRERQQLPRGGVSRRWRS